MTNALAQNMETKNKGFTIYFTNEFSFTTGFTTYTTNSEQRAIELFYRDYDKEDFKITKISYEN